ncbi:MAG TPA: sporulation transcriptional regulator SpoIIID [Candidatus Hungatella pullicola]|nr:sporulation transcriptional regulator SpoIIID [Candidatus Hungatella pullicola]
MKEYIEERAVEIANYIINEKSTVRQAAKKFGVSKSTIHKDDGVIIRIEFQGMRKASV